MFSANLGFLFTDRQITDRVGAAASAGFDAVECHFPYDTSSMELRTALVENGMTMLGLNTAPGDIAQGEFGLCALPGREVQARAAIDQAIVYGAEIGAVNVHVMAGRTDGGREAEAVYRSNLAYACDAAARNDLAILIEPINHRDVPGYHLSKIEHAVGLIDDLGRANLKLMFDCYHTQVMQGDLTERLRNAMPVIGHIQIAAVPDRGEPDGGEVHFVNLIASIRELGFTGPIGAEYRPRGASTEEGLGWLEKFTKELQ